MMKQKSKFNFLYSINSLGFVLNLVLKLGKRSKIGLKNKPGSKSGLINGFTIIELMVVVSIMVILATVLVINLAAQRQSRDILIAQNQLVSNIRKTQGYTLNSRVLPNGQLAQFYIIKFDLTKPNQYTIQALYNVSSSPVLTDVETVSLPPNIRLAAVNPITISRPVNPSYQSITSNPACALVAFAAPFGKIIFNDGCYANSPLQAGDDYYSKIINFQTNVACDGNNGNPPNPLVCSASTDSIMAVTLSALDPVVPSRTILVNAITGSVCPEILGAWKCALSN